MTTEERLERVERELTRAKRRNRWLMVAVGLAVGILALAWLATENADTALAQDAAKAEKPAQVIRASAFVLVDDKGRERGALKMTPDGPTLYLYDENEKPRAALTAIKVGPGLALFDEKGTPRAGLTVTELGPALVLIDENGKPRALLAVSKAGPMLSLRDENGKPIAGPPMLPAIGGGARGGYAGVGEGHWIKKNIDRGSFILLEDSSLWKIDPLDKINASLWLPLSDITVIESSSGSPGYDYLLINTDDGEKAHAKYIKR